MGNTPSTEEEVMKFKCELCKNILSVPPIILLSKDGTQMKCGRCEFVPKESMGRNVAFEDVIKVFSFPCINEGCNKKVAWDEVRKHEEECIERTIICQICQPLSGKIVRLKTLLEHMIEDHSASLYHDFFSVRLSSLIHRHPYVLICQEDSFLILIHKLSQSLLIFVASLNDNNNHSHYNVKLINQSNNNNFGILFQNQPITKYDERNHCFHCVNKNCDLVHHPYSRIYGNGSPKINWKIIHLTEIKRIFGNNISNILVSIELISGVEKQAEKIAPSFSTHFDDSTNHTDFEDILRNSLQCPICMNYMTGSIYNCDIGHSVCQECKVKLTKCPFCPASLGGSRNFTLENLAQETIFTCAYTQNGCEFRGKLDRLLRHENECYYNKTSK